MTHLGELFKRHDLSSLRQIFLAGEKLDSSTHQWLEAASGRSPNRAMKITSMA